MEGKRLAVAVGLGGLLAVGVGTALLHAEGPPPPPERPAPPPPIEAVMNGQLKYTPTIFRGLVEEDAKRFGVPAPSLEELSRPFPYADELEGRPSKLRLGAPIETPHLRISLEIAKHKATLEGQTFATEHLVLRIENRSARHLAYRIDTAVPEAKKCLMKGDLPHNAIVLEPRQTIVRSECLLRRHKSVDLQRIEVMELPPLAAVYASRLPATATLYDPRIAAGHVPLAGALCPQTFSWRELRDGLSRKDFGWRDVIDFYARHSCEEYSFFPSYRQRTDPAAPLPARPPL